MALWLAPAKAAKFIKEQNPNTMITEKSLRRLSKEGFPCYKNGRVSLFNMDTFDNDLLKYASEKVQ